MKECLKNFELKKWHIVVLSILLVLIDQIVKIVVKTNMTLGEEIPVFGNWFNIYFIENRGAAYGMELGGDYGKLILSLIRVVAIGVLIWYINRMFKKEAPKGVVVAFAFIMVGAMGNVIDSAFYGKIFSESTVNQVAQFVPWGEGYGTFLHGAVVDMLYFPVIQIDQMPSWIPIWGGEPFVFFSPIFNIADSYITCAVVYLILFQRKFFK